MTPMLPIPRATHLTLLLGWILLFAFGPSRPAAAQDAPSDFDKHFQDGRLAFEAGLYDEAIAHLEPLFDAQPAFHHHPDGAVAYWLGRQQSFLADDTAGWCLVDP